VGRLRATLGRVQRLRARLPARIPPWPDRKDGRLRLVVTGAGGDIGGILRDGLRGSYDVRGVDLVRTPGVDVVGDLRSLRTARRVVEGADVVLDLAADASPYASWDRIRGLNVPVTLNVLEAARDLGVRRVVFASSNHVVGLFEQDEPYAAVVAGAYDGLDPASLPRIGVDVPVRPDSPYGVSKALGEAAARFHAETSDLSAVCLRIGTVRLDDRPAQPRHFATLLTHRDLLSLVDAALSAPAEVRFGIYYGVSANTWRIWDVEPAGRELGFVPVDDAERLRPSG
jgi:dTDP-4-dehydrorhamnose reductase